MASKERNTTDHSEEDSSHSDWTSLIDTSMFVFAASMAMSCMVMLNTYLSKLNKIMKRVLNVLLAHTILGYALLAILSGIWGNDRDAVYCSIFAVFFKTTALPAFQHLGIFAALRYYLCKAARKKGKIPNVKLVLGLTTLMYLLNYFIITISVIMTTDILEVLCLGDSKITPNPYNVIFPVMFMILTVGSELYYDDKLIGFKKKNQNQATNTEERAFVIPIKASWLSLVCIFINAIILFSIYFAQASRFTFTTGNVLGCLFPTSYLMIILALTYQDLKQNETRNEDCEEMNMAISVAPPQSYVHLRQIDKEKSRAERNSLTLEKNPPQQLPNVSQIFSRLKEQDHIFDRVNVTNSKKIDPTQEDMNSLASKQDGTKNRQLPNLNKIQVKVDVHQEIEIEDSSQKCEGILKTYSDKIENSHEDIEMNEKSKLQDKLSIDDIDKIIEEELAHYNLIDDISANVTNAKKIGFTQEEVHQEIGIVDSTQKCQENQENSTKGKLKQYSDKTEYDLEDNVDIDISENDIDKMIEEELAYYNLTDMSTKNIDISIDCKTKELILSPKTLTFK